MKFLYHFVIKNSFVQDRCTSSHYKIILKCQNVVYCFDNKLSALGAQMNYIFIPDPCLTLNSITNIYFQTDLSSNVDKWMDGQYDGQIK